VTQAALIILDDARPTALVLGLSWPEFQLRRAVGAGALHLVLVADRVTRDVVEAVDRLRDDGVSTTLARTKAEVADLFHPDEAVLVMTGGTIVDEGQMQRLLTAPGPGLLCIDAAHAAAGQELIDANSHWIGHVRVDGAQIRAIVPLVGDWDLGSTLMRQAVAACAARTLLEPDDLLVDATMATGASRASHELLSRAFPLPSGWGERWTVTPLARLAMYALPALVPRAARLGQSAAAVLLVLGLLAQLRTWTTLALALYLSALLVQTAAGAATRVTRIPMRGERFAAALRDGVGAALLGLIAVSAMPDSTLLVLSIGVIAVTGLADRLERLVSLGDRYWLADRAGDAIILCIASMFGAVGLVIGLSISAAYRLTSLAVLQQRLSRVLTLTS